MSITTEPVIVYGARWAGVHMGHVTAMSPRYSGSSKSVEEKICH